MYDLYNNVDVDVIAIPQTLSTTGSPTELISSSVDLQGYENCDIVGILGDIDELGSSPVGSASVALALEHSDDESTWTKVALADVIGPTSVDSNGTVDSTSTDQTTLRAGYRMTKRYVRGRLVGTAIANGGNASIIALKGNKRHAGGETV